MDAGDTFIYGYPTFYQALQDRWIAENSHIEIETIKQTVSEFMKETPPRDLNTNALFDQYFKTLFRSIFKTLSFPGDIEKSIKVLGEEWLEGKRLRLLDDALSSLNRLRGAGLKLGVISNWDETLDSVLRRLEVIDLFEITIASCQVGRSKPDPEIFKIAFERANTTADQCWYLGDQIETDIHPAKALGMKTIYVDYYGKGGGDGEADFTANSFSVAAEFILARHNIHK